MGAETENLWWESRQPEQAELQFEMSGFLLLMCVFVLCRVPVT